MAKTYAGLSLVQAVREAVFALQGQASSRETVDILLSRLRRDQGRLEQQLGFPLRQQRILEVGPGQQLFRAKALGVDNTVTALDQDVIPVEAWDLLRMARANGISRVIKTLGRKALLVDARLDRELARALGVRRLATPTCRVADFGQLEGQGTYDVVASWSTFEHLEEPRLALQRVMEHLRPGGVFLIDIHLYTSNSGHHDIRSFTGREQALPVWGHLRPSERHLIHPSSHLNQWRLQQWRTLFQEVAPGFIEYQDRYGEAELRQSLTAEIRQALSDYSDDELFTVNLVFVGNKRAERVP